MVLPLYGISDIRASFTGRNRFIQADLTEQLNLAIEVLARASEFKPMHVLDELTFRLEKYKKCLKTGLSSGDEVEVQDFLYFSIEPLLKNIAGNCSEFAKVSLRLTGKLWAQNWEFVYKRKASICKKLNHD